MNPTLKTSTVGRMSAALSAVCIMPRTFFIRRITACGLIRPTLLFLGLIATTPAHAEELGRLFFTPAQRTQLDHSYAREARPDNNDRALRLDGIVQKHGGKRTAWINGVPQQAGSSDDKTPESLPLTVPGQSKPVKVKVGQKVLINPASPSGQ